MKRIVLFLIFLCLISCTNKIEEKINEDLKKEMIIMNEKVEFVSPYEYSDSWIDVDEIIKKVIKEERIKINELKKYDENSKEFGNEYEETKKFIIDKIADIYNSKLSGNYYMINKPTYQQMVSWISAIYVIENDLYSETNSKETYANYYIIRNLVEKNIENGNIDYEKACEKIKESVIPFGINKKSEVIKSILKK